MPDKVMLMNTKYSTLFMLQNIHHYHE